jgi:hypothetical protein
LLGTTYECYRARFPRNEVEAADIPSRHHCGQDIIFKDLHRCVGHIEDSRRGECHGRLGGKWMGRACCELEERKLDKRAVLGPTDSDDELDVAS